jgi:preprotein translocase subunit SecY
MFKNKQINNLAVKLMYVLLGIVIFRMGTYIPIYGVNPEYLIGFDEKFNKVLSSLNMFTGGALSQASIFSLAVMPYISASILIQILSFTLPHLKKIKENGRDGQAKIMRITRLVTIVIACIQGSYLCSFLLKSYSNPNFLTISIEYFYILGTLSLVAGSLFITWIAEQITERGIGNGVSLIIYIGIVSSLPSLVKDFSSFIKNDVYSIGFVVLIVLIMVLIIFLVTYIENIQKRLAIHLTGIKSEKLHVDDQYMPFKVNLSGVMPAIIAGMFVSIPLTVLSLLSSFIPFFNMDKLNDLFSMGNPYYYFFMGFLIIFFSFFYLKITQHTENILNTIKSKNIIIDKVRPGKDTEQFIQHTIRKLSIVGSIYLFTLIIIPDIFMLQVGFSFYFGGTSLLIMVLASLDWIKQISAHFDYRRYRKIESTLNNIGKK